MAAKKSSSAKSSGGAAKKSSTSKSATTGSSKEKSLTELVSALAETTGFDERQLEGTSALLVKDD